MSVLVLLVHLLFGGGELTAQQILEQTDKETHGHKDFYARIKIKIGGGSPVDPTIEVLQKVVGGKQMRLIRFMEPPDFRGMGVLAEGRDIMYVYLPGFDKVRRIGAHARTQSFMGSDFTYDDLGQSVLAPDYEASLVSTTAAEWVLDLRPRPGRDPSFARLRVTIVRKCMQISKLEYYDAAGVKVRTSLRDMEFSTAPHCPVRHISMVTHTRGEHRTEGDVLFYKLDGGLSDELFTVRSLARGN
ncbi:MAG TPA: outer membrane lipoprotein-sorting protein [Polyangia bacterium]|nr:outer membrane lipoprotein-sorting protein [Polyangia bacterium]